MYIDVIVVGQLEVNCYIVTDEASSETLIIDPGDEYNKILEAVQARSAVPKFVVLTHAHYDHVCAAGELKAGYAVDLVMHEDEKATYEATIEKCVAWGYDREDLPPVDRLVVHGDRIEIGGSTFKVLHTPGHTPGGISLFGAGMLFTGDTLFAGSVGRTDLPGGDREKLRESLRAILALPDETVIRSGHGPATTLRREKKSNPFLKE